MSVTILHVDQRSADWYTARVGRVTGSRACDVVARIKSGEAAARRDYRVDLVVERLTGLPADANGFVSKDMQRGLDLEPRAFALYEGLTGQVVRRTGFIQDDARMVGCSLDGDVGNLRGIVELKVPKAATHLRYLRSGVVPPEYLPQIQHNLLVTGAEWADFVSYDDRFPPALQLFRVRIHRQDAKLVDYEQALAAFLDEVDREYEAVATLAGVGAQLARSLAVSA